MDESDHSNVLRQKKKDEKNVACYVELNHDNDEKSINNHSTSSTLMTTMETATTTTMEQQMMDMIVLRAMRDTTIFQSMSDVHNIDQTLHQQSR